MANPVNHNATLLTLAAAASSVNGADQQNTTHRGIKVVVDITAITAGSLTVTIQGKDTASGKYYTLLASTALAAPGTTVLTVYPGAAVTANVSASDVLPATWRVISTVATGPVTATIGASVIV